GVGISEQRSHRLERIRIYPNPSHGQINLELPSGVRQITLFDITGRRIGEIQPRLTASLNLSPGVYFLRIKVKTRATFIKLVLR
ncbi:MAG TPA: T9SS type A sorting domain-containing protein, partial [bacterium (Candidatus Stahlbacteria)]|nr:T9SS type A sorting domain-containing protein [Candidatus Stahlbacteria bacterium]